MKFGQIIFSVSVGLLLFAALLVSENARFSFQQKIEDPFSSTKSITIFKENKESLPIDILSKNGEFFRFFPGSSANFDEGNRELINGEFFISSQFIAEHSLISAKNSFINPFSPSKFTPLVSQFKIGDIFLSIPSASVFIQRDIEKKQIKIYAIDHSVEVFLEGATVPFVIPANMFIDIRETILSEKTGRLYYTKLKKELRLNPSNLNLNQKAKGDAETIQDKVISSLEKKDHIHDSMKSYAQNIPKKWLWFESQGFIGNLSNFIQNAQIKFSLGLPKEKVNLFRFKQKIKPFVLANAAVKNDNVDSARTLLSEFRTVFKTKEWFELLLGSSVEKDWDTLVQSQQAWTRNIFPDDAANVFTEFWNIDGNTQSFSYILDKFSSTELLIPKKQYTEALANLKEIDAKIQKVEITQSDLGSITSLRRILFELMKAKDPFQKKSVFSLYGFLIRKEVEFYKNEKKQEIQLENAQDILSFLEVFLNKTDKSEISSLLVKFFNILDVDIITKKRGRRIFSDKELELIETIKFIGSSGLTEETIEAIKEQRLRESQMKEDYIKRVKTNKKEEIVINNLVDTNDKFLDLLEEDLDIEVDRIDLNLKDNIFKFSNASYKNLLVSGSYDFKRRRFSYLKVGGDRETNLDKNRAKSFLIFTFNNENTEKIVSTKKVNQIPQKTQRALSEKSYVREFFEIINVDISIDHIEALDFNYDKFKVKESIYNNNARLSFVYYKRNDVLENLIIRTGRTPLELPGKIKRENLEKEVNKAISNLLQEKTKEIN